MLLVEQDTEGAVGRKPRTRMPAAQRAKQFAPFKALDGLYEALQKAEEDHRRMLETGSTVNVPEEGGPDNDVD